MANIRIMSWNIQNLGPTKSGILHNSYDELEAITEAVVRNHIDVFVVVELGKGRSK